MRAKFIGSFTGCGRRDWLAIHLAEIPPRPAHERCSCHADIRKAVKAHEAAREFQAIEAFRAELTNTQEVYS
jgi:hypothetical protein